MTKVEDAITVEKANLCMEKCKQPVDVLKRILQSNLKEVQVNIQGCTQTARKVDPATNQISIDYEKASECLQRNLDILQLMHTKLSKGLSKF